MVLMHHYLVPPDDVSGHDLMSVQWKTEYDVLVTLREMGHSVRPVAIKDDLTVIRRAVEEFKPHIAFNMMENFHEIGAFDHNIFNRHILMTPAAAGCDALDFVHDIGAVSYFAEYAVAPALRRG